MAEADPIFRPMSTIGWQFGLAARRIQFFGPVFLWVISKQNWKIRTMPKKIGRPPKNWIRRLWGNFRKIGSGLGKSNFWWLQRKLHNSFRQLKNRIPSKNWIQSKIGSRAEIGSRAKIGSRQKIGAAAPPRPAPRPAPREGRCFGVSRCAEAWPTFLSARNSCRSI